MTTLANVFIWDTLVGTVGWDSALHVAFFEYDDKFKKQNLELAPLMMPISGQQIYSFPRLSEETFQGLPGLLADSLPDYFGNAVINAFLRAQGRPENSFDPVEKLCYIGKRGMGALEFKPALSRVRKSQKLNVNALSQLAAEIMRKRESFKVSQDDKKSAFHDILQVGSSAGGARPKAVIAWNSETNEVYSGQVEAPDGCDYWLLKFDVRKDGKSYGRIEYAYYLMAKAAGIRMSECRLLEDHDCAHFMSKRFDRLNGEKLHIQTLCAMRHMDYNNPVANSYEQAFDTMEKLKLLPSEKAQLFRRMVFNAVVRNHDDHTKNISFLMTRNGVWHLAPAYDMAWAYKPGSKWTGQHQMSINGKRDGFSARDFLAVAKHFDISKPQEIIHTVCEAALAFGDFAREAGVPDDIADQMLPEFRTYLKR
ncbi:MAG: type II toxin-antitoxin system HipA family toxin [Lentisphaeria bacterium]|nr:type II toxin-antitoxin system HipA family toxin [Lentisphaeria bacterium]